MNTFFQIKYETPCLQGIRTSKKEELISLSFLVKYSCSDNLLLKYVINMSFYVQVLEEVARILSPGGLLIVNFR